MKDKYLNYIVYYDHLKNGKDIENNNPEIIDDDEKQ
jgi:hypothetical protein